MGTYRIDRLNKEFMRLIAEMLASRIKNSAASAAILTHVDASRDLSTAKVYYTLIDDACRDDVQSALESVQGTLRGMLGREMYIRHVPELRFVYDDSERRARSMDDLIDQVMAKEEKKRLTE